MTCTWAASPRCMLRGLRAHQGVNVHVQGFVCERHTPRDTLVPKTQTTSPTTARFHRILPRWSALWAPHRLTSRPHHRQSEGIALHEGHHSPLVRASRPPNGGIGIIRGVPAPNAAKPPPPPHMARHRTITSNHSDTCPHIVVGGLALRRRRPPPYRRQQSSAQPENAAPFREHYTI